MGDTIATSTREFSTAVTILSSKKLFGERSRASRQKDEVEPELAQLNAQGIVKPVDPATLGIVRRPHLIKGVGLAVFLGAKFRECCAGVHTLSTVRSPSYCRHRCCPVLQTLSQAHSVRFLG